MLPCLLKTAPDSAKYAKASYVWRDQRGRGMLRARATVFGNGSLHLKHLRSRDSDTYYCDVFLPDLTKDTVVHNVIGIIVARAHGRRLRIPQYITQLYTRREVPQQGRRNGFEKCHATFEGLGTFVLRVGSRSEAPAEGQ